MKCYWGVNDNSGAFMKYTTAFMNDDHSEDDSEDASENNVDSFWTGSMLGVGECLGPYLLWEWQEQQQSQHSIRFLRLLESDLAQLHDVAYTLQQYPRVKFVVLCDLMKANGSSAHGVLHNVLQGERPCLRKATAV